MLLTVLVIERRVQDHAALAPVLQAGLGLSETDESCVTGHTVLVIA